MLQDLIKIIQSIILIFSMIFSQISGIINYKAVKAVDELHGKTDGYVFGICHPSDQDIDRLDGIGLGWVRFDIPYPYNANGELSGRYIAFKQRCKTYSDRGYKVMAITPYPQSYFSQGGFDPVAEENMQRTKNIAVFLCNDLRDYIGGLQVSNELNGAGVFTYPLNTEECALFIGIQLEALNEVKGDIIVGYNTASMAENFHKLMKPYFKYCDYVGTDMYYSGNARDYIKRIRKIYRITKLPVLLMEFGYLSAGAPKTEEERRAILQEYGYNSEAEARADIENFVAKLPPSFQTSIRKESEDPKDWGDIVFNKYFYHLYRENNGAMFMNCERTPEGQAEYFSKLMTKLLNVECLAGMMIYCYSDGSTCWFCGFSDCPYEVNFGLVDAHGNEKPAYYAVRDVIAAYRAAA